LFHTHAFLLSSIVPYFQIPAAVQADAIIAAAEGTSIESVLEEQCYVDESNHRSVIRAYRLHWYERLRSERIPVTPIHLLNGYILLNSLYLYFSKKLFNVYA